VVAVVGGLEAGGVSVPRPPPHTHSHKHSLYGAAGGADQVLLTAAGYVHLSNVERP
jgi:hypothetical protein